MTNLKAVNVGQNRFCGPAVLSILTGKSTDECAKVISRINGKYNITGVELIHLEIAAERLGFKTTRILNTGSGTLYGALRAIATADGMYIVTITGHFVSVEVKEKKIYFCDNHTKEPIPASSSARLSQQVLAVTKVEKNPDYKEYEPLVKPKIMADKLATMIFRDPYNDAEHHVSIQRQLTYSDSMTRVETVAAFRVKSKDELKEIKDMMVRFLNE